MSIIIGLTGGLGTGKSTVASFFKKFGAKVYDADRLAHECLDENNNCFNKIKKIFGKGILKKGKIDRRILGSIVFNDKRKLKKLEAIIHPEVEKEMKSIIKKFKKGREKYIVVFEVPLLFESNMDKMVDYTMVVKSSLSQQIERAVKNLGISKKEIKARISNQLPLKEKIRRADIIIDNSKNIEQTKLKVKEICEKLLKRIKK